VGSKEKEIMYTDARSLAPARNVSTDVRISKSNGPESLAIYIYIYGIVDEHLP